MNIKPSFSIIITAFNRKEFLSAAIRSCLEQTFPRDKFEIILVKNFVDPTIDSLARDNNCILYSNIGGTIGEQLQVGIEASSADIICFLDDDDLFLPNKLDRLYQLFNENSLLIYYHNSSTLIDEQGNPIEGYFPTPPERDLLLKNDKVKELRKNLRQRRDININSILTNLSCVSIRRSVIEPYIDQLPELIDGTDHFAFYISISLQGDMLINGNILNKYRIHRSTSNIFAPASIRSMSEATIKNFLKQGHVTNLLDRALAATDAHKLISCKILEEKFVIRSQLGMLRGRLSFKDFIDYIRCVTSSSGLFRKTTLFRLAFIFGTSMVPSVVGFYYNLYRLAAFRKNVKLR